MLVVLESTDGEIGIFPVEEMKTEPQLFDASDATLKTQHKVVVRGTEVIVYTKVIAFANTLEIAQFWVDKYEGGEFTPDVNYMI